MSNMDLTFIIGVFRNGVLLFRIGNPIICTHEQASFVVDLLGCANMKLEPGDYLAYDFFNNEVTR